MDKLRYAKEKDKQLMSVTLKTRVSTITPRLSEIKDPILREVLNDFAKILRDAFSNVYDDLNMVGVTKAVNLTRDLSAASGDVITTGIGFRPRSILFVAGVNGAKPASWGFSDLSKNLNLRSEATLAADQVGMETTKAIDLLVSSGNAQSAIVKSFNTDGFTLTWTKTGSPTGTGSIFCLLFS